MVNYACDVTKKINGYEYILMADGSVFPDVIEFSPFYGVELEKGFLWELQHRVYNILNCDNMDITLNELIYNKGLFSSAFDFGDLPQNLKWLLYDRSWFINKINANRSEHREYSFCGGFSAFLDALYGVKESPKIAKVPISYCPFCGAELPNKFQQINWWAKEVIVKN